ncbi:MAG TPA: G1 family glutamic endopeptidase [Streptosporangiaceae bacterium]
MAASAPASTKPRLPSLKGTNLPAVHLRGPALGSVNGIPVKKSGNWSGYVALPKSGSSTTFTYVYAQYTVPSVNCSKTPSEDAFAYHWVGLDGWNSGTVEQDGVADFCVGNTPSYEAWWETYPGGLNEVFAVNPGDAIKSSVTYVSGTKKYTLKLTDETTGQSFNVSESCGSTTCDNSSAEVITEGYTSSPWVGTADFGQEFYNSVEATGSGTSGSLTDSAWTTIESVAYGATSNKPMTQPGQIYQGESLSRSAFQVSWERVD